MRVLISHCSNHGRHRSKTRKWFAGLAVCLSLGAHPVAAGESDVLAIAPLLEAARAQNPEIRAAEARYQAMRRRPIQERTLPDPTVGARYHNEQFDRITLGESEFSFFEFSAEQEALPWEAGTAGRHCRARGRARGGHAR